MRAGAVLAVVFNALWIALGFLANVSEDSGAIVLLLVMPSLLGAGAAVLGIRRASEARQPTAEAIPA